MIVDEEVKEDLSAAVEVEQKTEIFLSAVSEEQAQATASEEATD